MGAGPPCERSHLGFRWGSLWGHEPCEGCAEMGAGPPCERSHLGLRWSSLCGHEPCEGCAEMGAGPPCERSHLGLRWSSLWGHETYEGCAETETCGKQRQGRGGGRREEGGEKEEEGTRGTVSSKRGPNTTGWLGTNEAGAEAPAGVNPFACWRSCRTPQQIVEHFSASYMAEVPW